VHKPPFERVRAHLDQAQEFVNSLIKNFNRHGITFEVPPGVVTNLIESPFFARDSSPRPW
jgi:hypothetical protein